MPKELTQHFLSAAWPPMPQEDFEALREDIEVNGQRMPIVIYEGQILDGWQRYKCLLELHREPDCTWLLDTEDAQAFVNSANNHRRHITASQRAMAQVEMSKWKPRGKPAPGTDLKSAAEMASSGNVSVRTIERAKEVAAKATPEVVAAVKAGEVSVKKAAAELKPKKVKPSKPILPKGEKEDEQKDDADLEEWKARTIEGQRLIAEKDEEIRRLCAEDDKAELLVAVQQYNHANGRIAQLNRTESVMKKQLDYRGRILTEVRKLMGVEKDSQIVAAILAMKKGANDF